MEPERKMRAASDLAVILRDRECALVLGDARGGVRLFFKEGVRDLEYLLDNDPGSLKGAAVADKVVGKAAAGMMAYGGVREVFGEVMSRRALPVLEDNRVRYAYGRLVDNIQAPAGGNRCPLEEIVAPAGTAAGIVSLLREHFSEMGRRQHPEMPTDD